MNFVDNDRFDRAQRIAHVGREEKIERFRRGDENVGRMAGEARSFGGRRISSANSHDRLVMGHAETLRRARDSDQRGLKIALYVDGQRLDGRYVEDAAAMCFRRRRRKHQAVDGPEECRQSFAGSRGSKDQRRFAARDSWPAQVLWTRGSRKNSLEPVAHGEIEKGKALWLNGGRRRRCRDRRVFARWNKVAEFYPIGCARFYAVRIRGG